MYVNLEDINIPSGIWLSKNIKNKVETINLSISLLKRNQIVFYILFLFIFLLYQMLTCVIFDYPMNKINNHFIHLSPFDMEGR